MLETNIQLLFECDTIKVEPTKTKDHWGQHTQRCFLRADAHVLGENTLTPFSIHKHIKYYQSLPSPSMIPNSMFKITQMTFSMSPLQPLHQNDPPKSASPQLHIRHCVLRIATLHPLSATNR